MAEYGLSDEQILRMPIRRFWLLQKNVNRLRAEKDIRSIMNTLSVNTNEDVRERIGQLTSDLGTVIVMIDTEREEGAIEKLKALSHL